VELNRFGVGRCRGLDGTPGLRGDADHQSAGILLTLLARMPRYQSIAKGSLRPLTSDDGEALIRLIAGNVGGFDGPGVTYTPIAYAHVTLAPGAQLRLPWSAAYSAFAYVLSGRGSVGAEGRPLEDGQLAVFGPGDHVVVSANPGGSLEVLLLGGLPIGAPIYHYGPFVMNTRDEIIQTLEDYQAGRLAIVPADQLAPRAFGVAELAASSALVADPPRRKPRRQSKGASRARIRSRLAESTASVAGRPEELGGMSSCWQTSSAAGRCSCPCCGSFSSSSGSGC
jgi:Pirin C-terminal cupin domain